MNKNKAVFTYFLLSIILIGSAALLARQVRHYLYERVDPLVEYRNDEKDITQVMENYRKDVLAKRQDILLTYANTQAFMAMATPVPNPSPTPKPLPTPTPIEPGKNWKINMAMGKMASLKDYKNEDFMKKVGEECVDTVTGNFIILEIITTDMINPKIKVQHVATGAVGYITTVVR
ncbi:MAG: hypothetical protein AB1656_19620 [Candidatus Omnitrophota bacterium]